jgi:hypothetical protein
MSDPQTLTTLTIDSHDRLASPVQLLQYVCSMLTDANGEPTDDRARVRVAHALTMEARANLLIQAWRPTQGAKE